MSSYTIEEIDLQELSDADLEPLVDLFNAIGRELRPRSVDLHVNEFRLFMTSPGRVRHRFAALAEDGRVVGFGQASESGRAVGLTQLIRRVSDPTTWIVTTTMVDPEHRGNGLGKWLKAAANLRALDRWPGGVYEETGNAFTNEAMLAINRQMGFEHELTTTNVEVSVSEAQRYLESRNPR